MDAPHVRGAEPHCGPGHGLSRARISLKKPTVLLSPDPGDVNAAVAERSRSGKRGRGVHTCLCAEGVHARAPCL